MKLYLLSAFLALPLAAQTVPLPVCASGTQVCAVIGSQGTDAMKRLTGTVPKTTTLFVADVCSTGLATNVSAGQIRAAVAANEGYELYSSDIVNAVLSVLQSQDVLTRVQKALNAGGNAAILITAVLKKLSPETALIIDAAPGVLQAILPAVGSPRDIIDLGKALLIDDSTIALGAVGGGASCKTVKAVAQTSTVKIDRIAIQ